ncbi:cytidine deaminase [Halalkalibacillus sediminis]|uniref:Cytidine deaminase n=1 Tax=Halalkalibacillus sediminis TaxID=2018042 RepID=A0A2I0QWY5_9BACI|nr:cytidine deaminase [Halalkalibacillus sediminis]PKR78815.1 cytidine deaminase [Halalkalibacillus sediminis]
MKSEELVSAAKEMLDQAYVPYSKFPVGAVLLTKNGKLYKGCNIENAAYPVACCAERVAIFKAISEGEREFEALAVIANTKRPVPPCGSCRQVMSEFFDQDMKVIISNKDMETQETSVQELLPFSFDPQDLMDGQEK